MSRRSDSAFSLLEILVAVTILALLMTVMLGITSSAVGLWRKGENRVDAYREARAALGVITRDLNLLVPPQSTNHFLLNSDGAFDQLPAAAESGPDRAGAVFFLSRLPQEAQDPSESVAEICEVGYFLGFERLAGSSNATLNLYRFFRSSATTHSNIAATNSFHDAVIGPTGEEMLARNIRKFVISPVVMTNGSVSTNFTPTPERPIPDWLEIRITAINQQASRQFPAQADWTSQNPPTGLTRDEEEFTTRVRLSSP